MKVVIQVDGEIGGQRDPRDVLDQLTEFLKTIHFTTEDFPVNSPSLKPFDPSTTQIQYLMSYVSDDKEYG